MRNQGIDAQNITLTDFAQTHDNFLFQIDNQARIRLTISYNGDFDTILNFVRSESDEIETYNNDLKKLVPGSPI